MPDRVIKRVNQIGAKEKQGQTFRFLNRRAEPYEWTDEVPDDDSEFQGLLDEEETTPYPDISAEPPGVELESEESNFQHNAGINPTERIQAARDRVAAIAAETAGPRLVEADEDEIVYEITFDLPDAGLGQYAVPPDAPASPMPSFSLGMSDDVTTTSGRRDPPRSHRSVIGHQQPLHDLANETVELLTDAATTKPTPPRIPIAHRTRARAPRMAFLQLGEVRTRRSVLDAKQFAGMTTEEMMHTTTYTQKEPEIDDTEHMVDPELLTNSKDKMKVWGYRMTQYNLKPGLRKFGAKGQSAAIDELTQLHVMDTWTAMDATKLSREDKMKALSSLLFLKEKQMGKIKGRACINGSPQRAYIPKEDAASRTVSTESTFVTAAIAANEKRKLRCFDIPSAFVNTDVDEDVLMVLKGELADMMIQIAPQVYRKYITINKKGTPILYVKLKKALYGLMRGSLLFYRKLRRELEDYGFTVNPYDPCVANKMTECGLQLMVIWHIDDLMSSCVDNFELTKFSCYLAKIYGPKLTMHTGTKHDYLGVDMEFNEDGTLDASMIPYLKGIMERSQNSFCVCVAPKLSLNSTQNTENLAKLVSNL